MKFTGVCLPVALAVLLAGAVLGAPAPREKVPADRSEMKVRLQLIAAESAEHLQRYQVLVKRGLDLQDNVRACMKSGDPRLAQYQQALQEAQGDLKSTKEKLVRLESERAKLAERLAAKAGQGTGRESAERTRHMLETILKRLDGIEKRLEKLERRK